MLHIYLYFFFLLCLACLIFFHLFSSSVAPDPPVFTSTVPVVTVRKSVDTGPGDGDGGPSHSESSGDSVDSFYETPVIPDDRAKDWYVPRWNIANDSNLDDPFLCRTLVDCIAPPAYFATLRTMSYEQLFSEFNVGAARQVCLQSEVRSRAEHELERNHKLRVECDARGQLLKEKDAEIVRLRSLLEEEKKKTADQVSVVSATNLSLREQVVDLEAVVKQKDVDIELIASRAEYLKSALDDANAACREAKVLISSLSSEKDGLASEVC